MPEKVVFTTEEWSLIETWTGEHEEQDKLLQSGPNEVSPGVAIGILVEMTTEGGIDDKSTSGIVRKLGLLISQFQP